MWLWIFWRAKHDWREFLVGRCRVEVTELGSRASLGSTSLSNVCIVMKVYGLFVALNAFVLVPSRKEIQWKRLDPLRG